MTREIDLSLITDSISEACIEINHALTPDMLHAIEKAQDSESSEIGKEVLSMIGENMNIAVKEQIPICQDTGMVTVFAEIGQDVHFTGGSFESAINKGVARGYTEGFLRKSVVSDPISRVNTRDNTPAIIHTRIVDGDKVHLTVTAKGFGSENTSRLFMLKPADGEDGIKKAILETVIGAGANACPPMVVGVGIGGNFEKCASMAKHALTREVGVFSGDEHIAAMERELLANINKSGIGPAGLGGSTTALAVNIETYPTHIAGLPLAVNICCHVNRHKDIVL